MSKAKVLQVSKNLLITVYNDNYKVVEYNNMTFEFKHAALKSHKYKDDDTTYNFLVFYADIETVFENYYEICELQIKSKKQLKDIINFIEVHDHKEFENNYVYNNKGE